MKDELDMTTKKKEELTNDLNTDVEMMQMEAEENEAKMDEVPPCRARPPTKFRIHHNALRHKRRAVPFIERKIGVRRTHRISITSVVPLQRAHMRSCGWVQQQLVRIEPMPLLRFVGTMHAKSIYRPRPKILHVPVPDFIREFRQCNPSS